jgi:hypothetical protein
VITNACCNDSLAILYYETTTVGEIKDQFCEPESLTQVKKIKINIEDEKTAELLSNGTRRESLVLSGRCVSPRYLPSDIVPGRRYRIKWQSTKARTVEGEAFLRLVTTSRLGLESVFGEYVELEVVVES